MTDFKYDCVVVVVMRLYPSRSTTSKVDPKREYFKKLIREILDRRHEVSVRLS